MVRRKMEASKQTVPRYKNRAEKNDVWKTADLFEGTTSIKDKGVRGKKVAVTCKKQTLYSKYLGLCSDRGRR